MTLICHFLSVYGGIFSPARYVMCLSDGFGPSTMLDASSYIGRTIQAKRINGRARATKMGERRVRQMVNATLAHLFTQPTDIPYRSGSEP
jgi:hypothetical protein